MKIATITFHNVNNYGALLQAYALQQTILNMGYDTELIDYTRQNLKDVLVWFGNKSKCFLKGKPDKQLYSIKEFLDMVFAGEGNTKEIAPAFNSFRKNKLKLSSPANRNNVGKLAENYDLVITGSDQVWNCGRVNIEPTYMLDFVNESRKKGSYAASFGISEIPEKYKHIYKNLLSDFSYLSVRENKGAEIIKDLIDREAKVVLDPTFLLNKEQWEKLPDKKIDNSQKYILVYQLEYSKNLMSFARKLSKEIGLPLKFIRKPVKENIEEDYCVGLGPDGWVEQFLNAEYIVTNSFHGTAFAINFNKNFFTEVSQERIRAAMSSRLINLLNIFDLNDRFIDNGENKNMLSNINYDIVNVKLDELRQQSLDYLKDMIDNVEKGL